MGRPMADLPDEGESTCPVDNPEVTLARRVRERRETHGWSQSDVAARMRHLGFGWHQTTVSRIEAGTQPITLNEASALAAVCGVDSPTLRGVRQARGLSLREVARRAEIDLGHLSKAERDEKPLSLDALCRLLEVLASTPPAEPRATTAPVRHKVTDITITRVFEVDCKICARVIDVASDYAGAIRSRRDHFFDEHKESTDG